MNLNNILQTVPTSGYELTQVTQRECQDDQDERHLVTSYKSKRKQTWEWAIRLTLKASSK